MYQNLSNRFVSYLFDFFFQSTKLSIPEMYIHLMIHGYLSKSSVLVILTRI